MIEETLDIETPDGVADALLFRPDTGAAGRGVMHLTDIRGIRDSQRQMAARLVAEGYVVLMPNIFYRFSKPPVFDVPFPIGDERRMVRFRELVSPLTPDAIERDMSAYIDFFTAQPSIRKGPMALVGYCFSGKLALVGAAMRPSVVAAALSFHGGGLVNDTPESPHRLLPKIKAALYFGHADGDRSMPAEAIATLNKALAEWGGDYESEVYEGARHGWTVPDHVDAYDPPQAERAFAKLSALLRRTLNRS